VNARWELNCAHLKALRLRAALSIEQLAKAIEEDPRIVTGIEKGYRRFLSRAQAEAYLRAVVAACKPPQAEVETSEQPSTLVAPRP
jgi:hypothetical protein